MHPSAEPGAERRRDGSDGTLDVEPTLSLGYPDRHTEPDRELVSRYDSRQ